MVPKKLLQRAPLASLRRGFPHSPASVGGPASCSCCRRSIACGERRCVAGSIVSNAPRHSAQLPIAREIVRSCTGPIVTRPFFAVLKWSRVLRYAAEYKARF